MSIILTPDDYKFSVLKWGFHIDTVKQFQKDMNIPAEDTEYYKGVVQYLNTPGHSTFLWKACHDRKILVQFVEKFRQLFKDIMSKGYDNNCPIDIHILGNGEIRIFNGHHRAAIAYVLGISITAKVKDRNKEWLSFLSTLNNMYPNREKTLYQEIKHPEFQDWVSHRNVTERTTAILNTIGKNNTLLDIGCCQGMLSFDLADSGIVVDAVEINDRYYSAAIAIKNTLYPSTRISILKTDAWELTKTWDWVLCLSVLHHELKKGMPQFLTKIQKLKNLSKKGIILELGDGSETQMKNVPNYPNNQKELESWLNESTGMTWEPILKGVPVQDRKSRSDSRWLWISKK